jgi:uncharacterized protein YcbK (DUF882 family)
MKNCKQCNTQLVNRNKNVVYCNSTCRKKWNYSNNEEYRLKEIKRVRIIQKNKLIEKYRKIEKSKVELIKMIKNNLKNG